MHVLVVGAGIVGITTAWELYRSGHQVSIIDQHDQIAQGTSFANGGQIAVSESGPWSRASVVWQMFKTMHRADTPFRLRLRADPHQWAWLWRFLQNCNSASLLRGISRNWHLAQYSQTRLHQTCSVLENAIKKAKKNKDAKFDYHASHCGILQLIAPSMMAATHKGFEREAIKRLNDLGAGLICVSPDELVAIEPSLVAPLKAGHIAAAIWAPNDESGDARIFAQKMANFLIASGVRFLPAHYVKSLMVEPARDNNGRQGGYKRHIAYLQTTRGEIMGDAVILANGTDVVRLARNLRLSLPILPVKGYSVSLNLTNFEKAPRTSLTDVSHRLVISRLGNILRVAGYAEIGYDDQFQVARPGAMVRRIEQLFPDAIDPKNVQSWSGLRPMTPDGAPIVGRVPGFDNFYLNCGHGALGWTLCHATAHMVADMLSGGDGENAAGVSAADFAPDRRFVS